MLNGTSMGTSAVCVLDYGECVANLMYEPRYEPRRLGSIATDEVRVRALTGPEAVPGQIRTDAAVK